MEIFSYVIHRWLFHGILWCVHITHHTPRKGWFEFNDIFSLIFALISILLIVSGNLIAVSVGFGIAVYGFVYFIAHDLFTHRRFLPFKSKNKILLTIRSAHQTHHQTIEKKGIEPFGLFIFKYKIYVQKVFQSQK